MVERILVAPVHFVADRDCLRLFEIAPDQMTEEEAEAFVKELSPLFLDYDLKLGYETPTRWWVESEIPIQVKFSPLEKAVGANLYDHMPAGEAENQWKQLINEVQMACHLSPLNQAREAKGWMIVNGLWFWRKPNLWQRIESKAVVNLKMLVSGF